MFCDDPEEWDGRGEGGRLKGEKIYVYRSLIHLVVQQEHNIVNQLYSRKKKKWKKRTLQVDT